MKQIYQQTPEEILKYVNSRESGLTGKEVKKAREIYGWNELAEGKRKSIPQIFFEQYRDFLVLILIASAIISGVLGDMESALVILIVITINAILGTVQTIKAEQSLQSRPGGQSIARRHSRSASGKGAGHRGYHLA